MFDQANGHLLGVLWRTSMVVIRVNFYQDSQRADESEERSAIYYQSLLFFTIRQR